MTVRVEAYSDAGFYRIVNIDGCVDDGLIGEADRDALLLLE